MKALAYGKRIKEPTSALDLAAKHWGYAMVLWGDKWTVRFTPKPRTP